MRVNPLRSFKSYNAWNSDKTLQALAKHVHSQLLPCDIDEDDKDSEGHHASESFPPRSLESAITHVATRVNYGAKSMPNQAKVPAHLCIWRWEVDEKDFHWLPKTAHDRLRNRLHERRQVRTIHFLVWHSSECAYGQAKDEVAALLSAPPEPDNVTVPSSVTPRTDKGMCPTVTDQPEHLETNLTEAISVVCRFLDHPHSPRAILRLF